MLYLYYGAFYVTKQKPFIVGLSYVLYGILLWGFSEIGNVYLNLLGGTIAYSLILFLLYDGKLVNKIISIASYIVVMLSGDGIVYFISSIYSDKSVEDVSQMTIENVPTIIMVKIVQFCLLNILLRFHKESAKLLKKDFAVLLLLNAASLLTTITIMMMDQMDRTTRMIICICLECIMMILNIILFYFFQRSKKAVEIAKENEVLETRFKIQSDSIGEIENIQANLKHIWHDINNHVDCMKQLIAMKSDEAMKYLDEFQKNMEKYASLNLFGNDVVDAVLYSKYVKAQSEGIKLEVGLDISQDYEIDRMDMCCIISNILDNAIEATSQLDDGKIITLKGVQRYGLILISAVNPVKSEPLTDDEGNYITDKENKKIHGLGLKSVEAVADKYCGNVDLRYIDGFVHVNVLLYQSIEV